MSTHAIAVGALQVNETNNFQHMLIEKNCSSSISCAMWRYVAYKHQARQGGDPPPVVGFTPKCIVEALSYLDGNV